ncbi:MAG: hypothetical protein PVJ08_07650 [Dehalococcoidia bacterium]|jgi:hypothetical protein
MVSGQALELMQHLNAAKQKIEQYCKKVKAKLDKCTLKDKKKALNALDVQIVATPENIHIEGVIPLEATTVYSSGESSNLLTIEQTSA